MKMIFLILIVSWTTACSRHDAVLEWAQLLEKEQFDWYSIEDSVSSKIKTSRFLELGKRLRLTGCIVDGYATSPKQIHWIDLNADGHDDFIYSGWCMPYAGTQIFIWHNGDYQTSVASSGIIVDVKKSADSTVLVVRSDACCCDQFNGMDKILILKDSINGVIVSEVSWHFETTFKRIHNQRRFTGLADTISLRFTPHLNDTITEDECTDEYMVKGNVTIEFQKGITGLILKDTVSEAEKWCLVMVDPNNLKVDNPFETQPFEINKTFSIGWVRRKEINILD